MGRARPGLLLIACGVALCFLLACLAEADLLFVPCRLDPLTRAWLIPFPIVQADGAVQIVNPQWDGSYDNNLRAVVRDDGNVEIVKDKDTKTSGNLSVVLDSELAANFNKYNFINLTSYDFHWWARGNLKIYNAGGGKKIELYLVSISRFHKKYYGEYEFHDNKIILLAHNCKRLLFWTSVIAVCFALFLIFLGFVLMVGDIISSLRAKKKRLAHNAR